jgi:hypothetical protein
MQCTHYCCVTGRCTVQQCHCADKTAATLHVRFRAVSSGLRVFCYVQFAVTGLTNCESCVCVCVCVCVYCELLAVVRVSVMRVVTGMTLLPYSRHSCNRLATLNKFLFIILKKIPQTHNYV